MTRLLLVLLWLPLLPACSPESSSPADAQGESPEPILPELTAQPDTGRWYSQAQAREGRRLFADNCAGCHGQDAVGASNWRSPDSHGNYPPPPLDGTAHGWHHPYAVLRTVIIEGGEPMGGTMPAWGDRLSESQIRRVIAGFQSYWPDDIYQKWLEGERRAR